MDLFLPLCETEISAYIFQNTCTVWNMCKFVIFNCASTGWWFCLCFWNLVFFIMYYEVMHLETEVQLLTNWWWSILWDDKNPKKSTDQRRLSLKWIKELILATQNNIGWDFSSPERLNLLYSKERKKNRYYFKRN